MGKWGIKWPHTHRVPCFSPLFSQQGCSLPGSCLCPGETGCREFRTHPYCSPHLVSMRHLCVSISTSGTRAWRNPLNIGESHRMGFHHTSHHLCRMLAERPRQACCSVGWRKVSAAQALPFTHWAIRGPSPDLTAQRRHTVPWMPTSPRDLL